MKVALLTDGVTPWVIGGMQRHSRMLAEHLAALGVHVVLFHTVFDERRTAEAAALSGAQDPAARNITGELVPYPAVQRYPGHYLAEEAEYSRRLLERYLETRCDASFIYAQGLTSRAFLAYRRAGGRLPPIGINTHGYEMFQAAGTLRSKLQHLMLRKAFAEVNRGADRVFCFSGKIRRIAEERIGVDPSRIIELPNAIDPAWISGRPTPTGAARRFTFIGRHDRRKGLPELLRSLGRMPAAGWSFDFIGPIPERHRINRPNLSFHGPVSDPARIMALLDDSDCLVCPSFAEGMPTVILEAMGRGNAIIATDVGATREIVDSSNGILLDRPTVGGIADAMRKILEMPAGRLEALKSASLDRARGYTWPLVARRHVEAMRASTSTAT